jgi:cytidylate kinase
MCGTKFLDMSRSKNKKYCSTRCNTDAGHMRYREKIDSGKIVKKKDSRDRREERRKRYASDINFKLSITLRTRLNAALKNVQKTGSAIKDLGCSIEELKKYLESKWQKGMAWDNYGKDGWHIDHILPISSFDLSNPEELKKACHYSNLQPMWARDNFKKSDTIHNINSVVYILAGPNGCGKSTSATFLAHKFNVIDYDTNSFNDCMTLALNNTTKPNLIITPIQAKRMKRELEAKGARVSCIYLREPKNIIVDRILARGGKITPTIDKRIARYESLKDRIFDYYGNQQEVIEYLSTRY